MRQAVSLALVGLAAGCGGEEMPEKPTRFAAAQAVLQAACTRCHPQFVEMSEDDWQSRGLIVPGNPAQSPLFRFLKGSGVGGPESMPREGSISAAQREQIKEWIVRMPEGAGSPEFRAASVVIASHCVSCHSEGTGLPDFALSTEAAWVSSGFVVPGMPETSYLVQRINGAGLGGDAETMPFDRPAIERDELAAIEAWIRAIP